ncbi:MAG: GntR family transcriptional regulator [Alphaproteobacteria bacterium]|nr:MAG: GntR family transcriptional regulator [Alphaproteobacteria bacterium]
MATATATRTAAKGRTGRGQQAAAAGPATLDVPKLQRNTLNDEVYLQLKEAIIAGTVLPGSTMTIRSLAASFGISPMPVREALRRLVAEHVLVMLPNRSVALPALTRERFRELTRIRTSLEGLAAEEATGRIDRKTIESMAEINTRMEQKYAPSRNDYLILNREFHFALYRSAGLPTLLSIIESLWLRAGPLLNIQQKVYSESNRTVQAHHRVLLKALRRGDAAAARQAIVSDIEEAAEIIGGHLPES